MTYFTADLHLGHANILSLCNRPFLSVEEMDEVLIANWNRKVKKQDTVYVIGDFIWDKKKTIDYLSALQGPKILVRGNHDHNWLKAEGAKTYFREIAPYLEIRSNGHLVTMCHYPMLEWKNSRKNDADKLGYLVHGHIHNRTNELYLPLFLQKHALNAGVDVNHYTPVAFEELMENNRVFKEQFRRAGP